jgi:hypothetical protein
MASTRAPRSVRRCAVIVVLAAVPGVAEVPRVPTSLVWGQDVPSIGELVRRSEAVVMGSVLPIRYASSGLLRDQIPETVFKLQVEHSLGNGAPQGAYISVRYPGGRYIDEKGKSFRAVLPAGVYGLQAQRRYVLFLRRAEKGNGWTPVGGPQGLFEVESAGRLLIYDRRPGRDEWLKWHGQPAESLLDYARSIQSGGKS